MKKIAVKKNGNAKPRVSIIVVPRIFPNPAAEHLLRSTSFIQSKYEIIVISSRLTQPNINNQQLTSLLKINPKMTQITILELETDLGLAMGRNIGAAAASSNILIFCDDDIVMSEDISPMIAYLENGSYQSVQPLILRWPDSTIIDSAGDQIIKHRGIYHAHIRGEGKKLSAYSSKLVNEQFPSLRGAFMGIKKEALLAIGGFDSSFCFNFDDVDLGWRMTLCGYKNLFFPGVKVLHQGGRTTNPKAFDEKVYRFLLVNHHALQLKVNGYLAWPFIVARFLLLLIKLEKEGAKSNNASALVKDTLAIGRMLIQRTRYVFLHRRVLKKKFNYAGRAQFNAMANQARFVSNL